MTYMPQLQRSVTDYVHEYRPNAEAELLKNLSRERLSQLILKPSESVYTARLEAELNILENRGFCDYFLIVADYVDWAKANGIAVGPGRGAGPCSLVGYALGITNVDPIKYDLPFERFINPERDSVPDFDIDFCHERFGEVAGYIQSRHGADRVAQISSEDAVPLPSRLVIGDRPLAELIPTYTDPESKFLVTKMTIPQIAEAGLVQFNVINQQILTAIQHAVQKHAKSNALFDINQIPMNDSKAYNLLSGGEISNNSSLDSGQYKSTLQAVQPTCFEDLCAVIAMSYPALQDFIPTYLERKSNPESINYLHSTFENITAETHGIFLYQEQVMHAINKVAGLSMSQSDILRRALKKTNIDTVSGYKNKFIDRAIESGFSRTELNDLFDQIAISSRNTFNKSHAVAFAMITYQAAWLKANT